MRVGFIGCGNVGAKLAGSLLRNGFDLVVRDLDPDAVRAALTPLIAARPYAHWAEIFEAEDVPFAPVNGLEDLARDPQLKARGMVRSAGAAQVMAFPVPMAGMSDPAGHVPAVGEHQAEILDQAEKLE